MRYFLEISYHGERYAGFQIQQNALTVQEEVERALQTFLKRRVMLTGSSRTDAGVHARQNYFHFDSEVPFELRWLYNLNALLPPDIAALSVREVAAGAHCRFDAIARRYRYTVYTAKDPFLRDRGYYFPYRLDVALMRAAAEELRAFQDFSAFAKRNSQAKTHICTILESEWREEGRSLTYHVSANRFLRGMVRGVTGTMLQVGRGRLSVDDFRRIVAGGDSSKADFSVPGCGLCLEEVVFPGRYFG